MKSSMVALLLTIFALLLASSAQAAGESKANCASHKIFHFQPSYQSVAFRVDSIQTVTMVNQVGGSGYVYECKCEMEDCFEENTGVVNPNGNVYDPDQVAQGCHWRDGNVCECTQPK